MPCPMGTVTSTEKVAIENSAAAMAEGAQARMLQANRWIKRFTNQEDEGDRGNASLIADCLRLGEALDFSP